MNLPAEWLRRAFWIIIDRLWPAHATQQRQAYHEAGHAVVAWSSGETVELVRISPFPPKIERQGDEKNMAVILAVAYGGISAEERLTANPKPSEGADTDLDKIEEILKHHLPPSASKDEWRRQASTTARSIVQEEWDRVTAVAGALLDEGCLTGKRFAEIVGARPV